VTEVSFGWKVADWIEANCVIPDGWRAGEAYTLTAEMRDFLARFYAVDPRTGTFIHRRGGQLIRPQKWGKGPFSAAIICAEAMAPVVPVLEYGKFTLKRWPKPWIQVTAVSEDQTVNVFSALIPMIALGPLAHEIPDSGLGRINLPSGGWIEPVTASGRSRLGSARDVHGPGRDAFVVAVERWVDARGQSAPQPCGYGRPVFGDDERVRSG
jgi:hypothetical protein